MNEKQININKLLQYNEKESKLYMPNEIFNDLKASGIKSKHIPLAYSYYYLISWLYRYTKYQIGTIIDHKLIKQLLGYSPTYPEIDYIIKRNGELDKIGYTTTEKDIPLSWTFEDDFLDFYMLSDLDEDMQRIIKQQLSRKYTIKFPNKAFHRSRESEEDKYLDGTFYDISNTHLVEFEVFTFCMNKKEIGVTGFYLWSYLKIKNQLYSGGYDVSLDDLSCETGIARSTMCEYLNRLKEYKMIKCVHNQEYFCFGLDSDEKKANTYITNEWEYFSDSKMKIERMKFVSTKEHEQIVENREGLVELFG